METWMWVIAALLLGAMVGGGVVFLVARRRWADAKRAEEVQRELDEYRQDVSDHFVQTAELVNNLTRSYKAVYDHLEQGAYRLVDEETLRKQLGDVDAEAVRLEYIGRRERAAVLGAGGERGEARAGTAGHGSPEAGSVESGSGAERTAAAGTAAAGTAAPGSDAPGSAAANDDGSSGTRSGASSAWDRPAGEHEAGEAPMGWATASTWTSAPERAPEHQKRTEEVPAAEPARGASAWAVDAGGDAATQEGDAGWAGDSSDEPAEEEAAQADGRSR